MGCSGTGKTAIVDSIANLIQTERVDLHENFLNSQGPTTDLNCGT